jgi:hypothetical protein
MDKEYPEAFGGYDSARWQRLAPEFYSCWLRYKRERDELATYIYN